MKHIEKIQNILKSELEDYSFDYNIELDYEEDEEEQYTVKVEDRYWEKLIGYITFRVEWEKVSVELWEESWYEIETFEFTIKYFWIALLS